MAKAWEDGTIVVPEDDHPGQLSTRAADHRQWMHAEKNTYEIEYEEVSCLGLTSDARDHCRLSISLKQRDHRIATYCDWTQISPAPALRTVQKIVELLGSPSHKNYVAAGL